MVCAGAAASVGGGYIWCIARPSMKGMILVEKYRRMRVPSVEKWGDLGWCSVKGGGRNVVVVEDE